jgi:hypothetical protein
MSHDNYKAILLCLDEYMEKQGKKVINEMEANSELARNGLLDDDLSQPGRPLRELLASLRDNNLLPSNIKQSFGSWTIRNSRLTQLRPLFCTF